MDRFEKVKGYLGGFERLTENALAACWYADGIHGVTKDTPLGFQHQLKRIEKFDEGLQPFLIGQSDDNTLFLAFRGSKSARDWVTNFSAYPSFHVEGKIHAGFFGRASQFPIEFLLHYLREGKEGKERKLVLTGYSQGSAVAELLTVLLFIHPSFNRDWIDRITFIGFGCPLIGDQTFSKFMNENPFSPRFHHYVNKNDIIPSLALLSQKEDLTKAVNTILKAAEFIEDDETISLPHIFGDLERILPNYSPGYGTWNCIISREGDLTNQIYHASEQSRKLRKHLVRLLSQNSKKIPLSTLVQNHSLGRYRDSLEVIHILKKGGPSEPPANKLFDENKLFYQSFYSQSSEELCIRIYDRSNHVNFLTLVKEVQLLHFSTQFKLSFDFLPNVGSRLTAVGILHESCKEFVGQILLIGGRDIAFKIHDTEKITPRNFLSNASYVPLLYSSVLLSLMLPASGGPVRKDGNGLVDTILHLSGKIQTFLIEEDVTILRKVGYDNVTQSFLSSTQTQLGHQSSLTVEQFNEINKNPSIICARAISWLQVICDFDFSKEDFPKMYKIEDLQGSIALKTIGEENLDKLKKMISKASNGEDLTNMSGGFESWIKGNGVNWYHKQILPPFFPWNMVLHHCDPSQVADPFFLLLPYLHFCSMNFSHLARARYADTDYFRSVRKCDPVLASLSNFWARFAGLFDHEWNYALVDDTYESLVNFGYLRWKEMTKETQESLWEASIKDMDQKERALILNINSLEMPDIGRAPFQNLLEAVVDLRCHLEYIQVIGVCGPQNSGKSSLLQSVWSCKTNPGLENTRDIGAFFCEENWNFSSPSNKAIVLVDSPGFDDNKIPKQIQVSLYPFFSGVVYVAKLSEVHSSKNFEWYRLLVNLSLPVILCITHIDEAVKNAKHREQIGFGYESNPYNSISSLDSVKIVLEEIIRITNEIHQFLSPNFCIIPFCPHPDGVISLFQAGFPIHEVDKKKIPAEYHPPSNCHSSSSSSSSTYSPSSELTEDQEKIVLHSPLSLKVLMNSFFALKKEFGPDYKFKRRHEIKD